MSTSPRLVPPGGDYYMAHGHALTGTSPTSTYNCDNDPGGANNYTCIGVPVGLRGLGPAGRDGLESREEGGVTERETETLNKARQLVYNTDNSAAHLGPYVAPSATAYHPHPHHQPPPPPHHVYPTRSLMFSGTVHQPPSSDYPHCHHHHHQSCAYMSTSPRLVPPGGDYYMAHGHALTGTSPTSTYNCDNDPSGANNYTCIGVPVGLRGLGPAGRDGLESREEGGVTGSWGRSYVSSSSAGSEQHHLDSPY
ncbi:hypothetical protein Cgig2_010033 [Carnegiea gigantea]|uniref:Uncharacterized protein n=1 Tax=Carnegiea gigantea TaxID=171969 RepID=A0A9Q1GUD3_9CARY|nr:hypothetical protein Cgig2_010033 [Carnegiea gigantea]